MTLFFSGCEKESSLEAEINESIEESQNTGLSISIVGNEKIQENQELSKRIQRFNILGENKTQSKNVTSSKYDFSIDTNYVSYISNEEEDYESYTFPVYRDEFNPSVLENLLISTYPDNTFKAFLITYKKHKGEDNFNEAVSIEQIEDEGFIESLLGKNYAYCITVVQEGCSCNVHNSSSGYEGCSKGCYFTERTDFCAFGGGDSGGSTPYTPPNYSNNNSPENGTSGSSSSTNGSGTGNSTQDTTTPTESPLTQLLNCMPNLLDKDGVTEWLNNHFTETRTINDFLKSNTCSNEAKDFTESAIEALMNDGEVDFDDNVILDSTFVNNQKVKCIYDKLKTSSKFKKLILDTFGENDKINLTFKVVDSIPGANGNAGTLPNSTNTINPVTGEINLNLLINLDGDYISNSSAIAVAKTILHESIHAYLILKHIKCNIGTPFDDILEEVNDKKLDEMLNYYYDTACPDEEQHEFMFDHMIPTMSNVLQEIRDDLIPQNHQEAAEMETFVDLNNLDGPEQQWNWNDFYKYLSMAGLHNTDAFQWEIPLGSKKKENFDHYIRTGIQSFKKDCEN